MTPRSTSAILSSVLAVLPLAAVRAEPAQDGPCPVAAAPACVLTLHGAKGPSASAECASAAWSALLRFPQPQKFSDSNGDGWWETVVEIRLDPTRDCGCARFRAFYEDAPTGFTLDVGNSPTNDGHGGDQGTTMDAAEVQVLERRLTVYTASRRQQVDKLLDAPLPTLPHGTLELEICDQTLEARLVSARGVPAFQWKLGTLAAKLLFALSPPSDGRGIGSFAPLHAAFNRVVHQAGGAPSHGRVGKGLRRVEISLHP